LILSSGENFQQNFCSIQKFNLLILLDVPVNEPGVAEINEKIRYNPSILELKPNIQLGTPPSSQSHGNHGSHGHGHSHSHSHSHSEPQSYSHSQPQSYQPLKFRPTAEYNEHKPSYITHHSSPSNSPSSSSSFTNQGDVITGTHSGGFKPSLQVTKPKPTVIKLKKQEVKKVKLITPGLKHYATTKFVARNDYSNYFRSRSAQEEQRDASYRLVQSLYRRSPRTLLVPQYAPEALNYEH
jgi:hypothetical protein